MDHLLLSEKEKRRARRKATFNAAVKNHRIFVDEVGGDPSVFVGLFKKHKAGGCHKARCGLCHGYKRYKHKATVQEARNSLFLDELE